VNGKSFQCGLSVLNVEVEKSFLSVEMEKKSVENVLSYCLKPRQRTQVSINRNMFNRLQSINLRLSGGQFSVKTPHFQREVAKLVEKI
jgi:hypothetical protein